METVNVGIIGTGGIAQVHLRTYAQLEGVRVLAAADVVAENVEKSAERWDIPHVFTDYQKMLEMDELDAVDICTPHQIHRKPTVEALKAGKHVMVEKPMAATLEDATAMVRTSHETGRILMCAVRTRFFPHIKVARQIVGSGELGDIYYAETGGGRRRGIPENPSFLRQASAGHGAVADIGVYSLDTALYIMGHPKPVRVSAIAGDFLTSHSEPLPYGGWKWNPKDMEVEDFGAAFVRFDTGTALVFKIAWAMHLDSMGDTFFLGTEAGLKLGPPLRVHTDKYGCLMDMTPDLDLDDTAAWMEEIGSFRDAVRSDGPSPIDPDSVLLTNVIIDAIFRSAQLGREVDVEIPEI